jgi:hypothetical protein
VRLGGGDTLAFYHAHRLGISEFRTVTGITFGILGKATSQRLHHYTDVPLLIFLSSHIGLALWGRLGRHDKGVDQC